MHLTDQEKKLLVKMRLEGDNIYKSTVFYNFTDPFEEKEREELKEKLRIRERIIDRFLEVDIKQTRCSRGCSINSLVIN